MPPPEGGLKEDLCGKGSGEGGLLLAFLLRAIIIQLLNVQTICPGGPLWGRGAKLEEQNS